MKNATLAKANEAITGPRCQEYGDPVVSHGHIATVWSVLLRRPVTPEQVAMCMIAVKLVRLAQSPTHADSWIDVCGYGGIGGDLATETQLDRLTGATEQWGENGNGR